MFMGDFPLLLFPRRGMGYCAVPHKHIIDGLKRPAGTPKT